LQRTFNNCTKTAVESLFSLSLEHTSENCFILAGTVVLVQWIENAPFSGPPCVSASGANLC